MVCPRCGAIMQGGICNACGFPENMKRFRLIKCVFD